MINSICYNDQIDHDYFNLYTIYKNKFKDDQIGFNIAMAKAREKYLNSKYKQPNDKEDIKDGYNK